MFGEMRAVARGLAAGVFGTGAMTAWQSLSTKLRPESDGESQPAGDHQDPWEQAPVPARVGRRAIEGVLQREVSPERIGVLTNVMHWGYGTGWGAVYGLLGRVVPGHSVRRGLLFGTAVWATSYLTLVPMGLYQPPWEYEPSELALDLSYHLVYGAGVAGASAALGS
jgi:hypothetical protein